MGPDRGAEVVITTPRLYLREVRLADLDFVSSLLADPAVMRFYPKTYSRVEAEEWIARRISQYQSHGYSLWLVSERTSGVSVGQVGLIPQVVEGAEEDEIGYLIAAPLWRRGYATEAAAAVRDIAFWSLGKKRVISLVRPENTPSQGVARRIGMTAERSTLISGLEHLVFAVEARPSVRLNCVR